MNDINTVIKLIEKEGWEIKQVPGKLPKVLIDGLELPLRHPAQLCLRLYRDTVEAKRKFYWMKKAHDYLWPDEAATWNYWTERCFKTHCEGWNYVTYAGGANCAKSYHAAKIASLDYLSDMKRNAVLVASTSLAALDSRIWGYIKKFIFRARKNVPGLPVLYHKSKPPKITYNYALEGLKEDDSIHGMFAIAAKKGDDETAISNWIGRHPERRLILILDEATDMPMALLNSFINLDKGSMSNKFQCIAIGNSNSVFDIHGVLSTPKEGWTSVTPAKEDTTLSTVPTQWETVRRNGLCLFFSCYESPAIHESDPLKKKKLSEIFITESEIESKKREYGDGTDKFFRMTLGFWRLSGTDENLISAVFLAENNVSGQVEWSGHFPWKLVGGLDPAYSEGGDDCIFRVALLGQDVTGKVVLDYRGEELLYRLQISATQNKSVEFQIADQVIEKSKELGLDIGDICVDANGAGRSLADVIQLRAGSLRKPTKIYAMRVAAELRNAFDIVIKSTYELWFSFKQFVPTQQIRGLDNTTLQELSSRLEVQQKNGRKVLETKRDYKLRMGSINPALGHSPDRADAAALCLQSAILNYGFVPGLTWNNPRQAQSFEDSKVNAWKALNTPQTPQKITVKPQLKPDFSSDISFFTQVKGRFSGY